MLKSKLGYLMAEETLTPTETTETATTEATTESASGEPQSTTSYMDGKYDSISALENGYKELQSTFSKKTAEYNDGLKAFNGAPESYELSEGTETTPRIDALMEWGKENGLNNDALNGIIEMDSAKTQELQAQAVAQAKEELGNDADTRIKNVVDWAKANLGDDAIGALDQMITTADGVKMFEAIAKMQSGTAPAPSQVAQGVDAETLKQMRFAKNDFGERKMSSDPKYRAKVEALEAQASQNR